MQCQKQLHIFEQKPEDLNLAGINFLLELKYTK